MSIVTKHARVAARVVGDKFTREVYGSEKTVAAKLLIVNEYPSLENITRAKKKAPGDSQTREYRNWYYYKLSQDAVY